MQKSIESQNLIDSELKMFIEQWKQHFCAFKVFHGAFLVNNLLLNVIKSI